MGFFLHPPLNPLPSREGKLDRRSSPSREGGGHGKDLSLMEGKGGGYASSPVRGEAERGSPSPQGRGSFIE